MLSAINIFKRQIFEDKMLGINPQNQQNFLPLKYLGYTVFQCVGESQDII